MANAKKATLDLQGHLEREMMRERERAQRKIVYAFVMLGAVYVTAIAAFHYLEKWNWEDSIYFTTSTITTVGYGDLVPHTYLGRLFTIPLMLIGIAVGLYFIYTIQEYGKSKIERRIDWTIEHVDRIRSGKWKTE